MKKKIFYAPLFLLLAIAGTLLFLALRTTDEKLIRRTLDDLCRTSSKSARENPAVTALKANRTDKIFHTRCRFNFNIPLLDGEYTPTEIGSRLVRLQGMFNSINITASDMEITLDNSEEATVFFTGEFTGVSKHGREEKVNEIRDIEVRLIKNSEGSWKISNMDIRKVLEK